MEQHNLFDREYCHAIKAACLRAIANTSYRSRGQQDDTIPANEIYHALIEIMGAVAATEDSLPIDMQSWAEGLAGQFAESFHAAKSLLSEDDLDLLRSHYPEPRGTHPQARAHQGLTRGGMGVNAPAHHQLQNVAQASADLLRFGPSATSAGV